MSKLIFMGAVVLLLVSGFWSYHQLTRPKVEHPPQSVQNIVVAKANYWTCPMHPQIHTEQPGECPICHMALVEVKVEKGHNAGHLDAVGPRSVVRPTPDQSRLVGIHKVKVARMDLTVQLPIAGRLISPARIAFQVYEEDLRSIGRGLRFTATSSLFPEQDLTGTIVAIDKIADPTSRTIRVLGAIRQGPSGLIAETTFSGAVTVPLKDVIAIPEDAVLHAGQQDLVYVLQADGSLLAQAIKVGRKAERHYEVLEGLAPGEWISAGPNFLIDSEAKIRATSTSSDQSTTPLPKCPTGQHWDQSMSMCMPGEP